MVVFSDLKTNLSVFALKRQICNYLILSLYLTSDYLIIKFGIYMSQLNITDVWHWKSHFLLFDISLSNVFVLGGSKNKHICVWYQNDNFTYYSCRYFIFYRLNLNIFEVKLSNTTAIVIWIPTLPVFTFYTSCLYIQTSNFLMYDS